MWTRHFGFERFRSGLEGKAGLQGCPGHPPPAPPNSHPPAPPARSRHECDAIENRIVFPDPSSAVLVRRRVLLPRRPRAGRPGRNLRFALPAGDSESLGSDRDDGERSDAFRAAPQGGPSARRARAAVNYSEGVLEAAARARVVAASADSAKLEEAEEEEEEEEQATEESEHEAEELSPLRGGDAAARSHRSRLQDETFRPSDEEEEEEEDEEGSDNEERHCVRCGGHTAPWHTDPESGGVGQQAAQWARSAWRFHYVLSGQASLTPPQSQAVAAVL